ncbi:hypothetical protein AHAS_Ahas12G0114700 [Arachis hypogaea]
MDKQFVLKFGMTFKTLEEAGKFYKDYSKLANFSTKIRNTTRKEDEIKNQLIAYSREENKSLSSNKLSSHDLCTYIERSQSLDNFQSCYESFTLLLSRSSTDAQTTQGAKHVCVLHY